MSAGFLRRLPTPAASCALTVGLLAMTGLSGCATAPVPITDQRWQVVSLYTADSSVMLSPSAQDTTWMGFGNAVVTGAAGCIAFTAPATWGKGELTLGAMHVEPRNDGTPCSPADEETAHQIATVLGEQTLKVEQPEEWQITLRTPESNLGVDLSTIVRQ